MNLSDVSARMQASAHVIESLTTDVPTDQASWKPAPNKWSLLEVTCHLLDEEREDFRVRLRSTLEDPTADWPPIDPTGWVEERDYASRNLDETRDAFLAERAESMAWLGTLGSPDLERAYDHPKLGPMRAGELLASWAVHDLLHIRQLTALHHGYLTHVVTTYPTDYAGPW